MKLTSKTLVSALMCGIIATSSIHSASAVNTFDDNQVPIENRAMDGSLHIMSDDTLEEEVVDPPSMLTSKAFTNFCTSADSGDCAGQSGLQFIAHLPQCDSTETTDCIVSLTATPKSGPESSATFNRYFPNTGPQSYTGKPSIKLPTGRAPSVWKIPSAPHIGGDEYAVVARLRGSTERRSAASFQLVLTPVSLKADADTSNNYEAPRWTAPGRMAGPASDRGLFRCAYWGASGSCLLSHSFPVDMTYTVTVRLAAEPAGWLHGRIGSPTISFTKDGSNTLVKVTAAPVQVPAFQVGKMHNEFPAKIQTAFAVNGPYGNGGSRQPGGQDRTDPALRNAEYNITSYKDQSFAQLDLITDVIEDKAGWAPWMWRVRTLSDGEMSKAGKCLTTGDGVKGIVTTNATVYGSGPPAFNTSTETLDYKVAAPHFTRTGEVFKGAYNLIMRSDVARCFYNFTSEPVKAEITVIDSSSAGQVTTSVSEADGWLKLSAVGFSHSSPTVRAKLTQDRPPAIPAAVLTTKIKKSLSSTTLARAAKLAVPKKAKISLSVSAKYSKICKASGTTVRTLKKGKCVVKVTVTTTAKKRTSKNVTVTVK
jgi:hypothetical protein